MTHTATRDSRPAVSVLVDSLIGFYTLEPLVHEFEDRGVSQHIYCVPHIANDVTNFIGMRPGMRMKILPFQDRDRWALYAHRFLRQLATRPSFSFQYRLISAPEQYCRDWRHWLTARLAGLSPGLPHRKVNGALNSTIGKLVRNRFVDTRLVTTSRSSFPHALCAPGLRVTTVMESWDHPVKWPVGHRSSAVFAWNADLARDWQQYQGDTNVHAAYPLKLRYWLEGRFPSRDSYERRVAIYAVGTSSMTYINDLHKSELEVIEQVCEATARAGWRLIIKPKPNGKTGDFDHFTGRHAHVTLGEYRDAPTPADYYLDDEYNRQRERELDSGDLLINAVTTFGLDASLGGLPCLQLDLRQCKEFGRVAEGQENHHIERYLLQDPGACLVVRPGGLVEQLAAFLKNPDRRASRHRDKLRAWLKPAKSLHRSVSAIADSVLSTTNGVFSGTPLSRHLMSPLRED